MQNTNMRPNLMLDDYRETYIDKIPDEEKKDMVQQGFTIAQKVLSQMFGIHATEYTHKGYNEAPIVMYIRCLYFYTLHDIMYIPLIDILEGHEYDKLQVKQMIKEIATSRSPKVRKDVGRILNTLN